MKKTTPSAREAFGRRGFLKIGLFGACLPALNLIPAGTDRISGSEKESFVIFEWYTPEGIVYSA